jgi:hypothetical protein
MDWPLGSKEDLQTEFKRADALRKPANIAREVVGFLNAEGGVIWIGVGENGGVADSVDAIPDPDREMGRLQDGLIDLVEPKPVIGGEIEIEKVPFPGDPARHLIRVSVSKGIRRPYALLHQGARAFLKRSGSRLHELTRQELAEAFGKLGAADQAKALIDPAVQELGSDLYSVSPKLAREGGLRVIVRPVGDAVALDLNRDRLLPLLQEAKRTGNRPLGWNFTSSYSSLTPLPDDGSYRFGEKDSVQWLDLWRNGKLDFSAVLDRLSWRDEQNRLWPFALLELPISVARLASTLYADHASGTLPPDTLMLLGIGLFGIGEMTLSPHSPHSIAYQLPENARRLDTGEVVKWAQVSWSDLRETPDRCAYQLVRQVYRAFGFEEEQLPEEYDRERNRLTIPA